MQKSILYKNDYTYIYDEDREENVAANEFWEAVAETGFLQRAYEVDRAEPRILNPKLKEVFDYMVTQADAFALDFGGVIEAYIEFDTYTAKIDLLLPFFDLKEKREKDFMMKAMVLSDGIEVVPAADEVNILVRMIFSYFARVSDPERDAADAAARHRAMLDMKEKLGDYNDEDN